MKSGLHGPAAAALFLILPGFLASQVIADHKTPAMAHGAQSRLPEGTQRAAVLPSGAFVIGAADRLSINVWKEPDLTQAVQVRSDGKISLPLIGELEASGRTPLELQQDITNKLRAYITEPNVTVMVTEINSQRFNILGRVAKPGSYSLTAGTTVLDAIAEAGGFQEFAKQKAIYILRPVPGGGTTRIAFNYKDVIRGRHPEENITLRIQDTIVVP